MWSSSRCVAIERRRAVLLAAMLAAAALPVLAAAPPPEAALLPGARLVGEGKMRFFGLKVYEARLWAAEGFDPAHYEAGPLLLELRYARALRGAAIAERSLHEMQRMQPVGEREAGTWLEQMTRAFPDVQPGERLSGLLRDGRARFFHEGRPTAAIDGARFARLFFGIWLADTTPEPGLRRELLGAQP